MMRPEKETEIGAQLDRIFNGINEEGLGHCGQMVRLGGGVINMLANIAVGLYEVADAIKELRRG